MLALFYPARLLQEFLETPKVVDQAETRDKVKKLSDEYQALKEKDEGITNQLDTKLKDLHGHRNQSVVNAIYRVAKKHGVEPFEYAKKLGVDLDTIAKKENEERGFVLDAAKTVERKFNSQDFLEKDADKWVINFGENKEAQRRMHLSAFPLSEKLTMYVGVDNPKHKEGDELKIEKRNGEYFIEGTEKRAYVFSGDKFEKRGESVKKEKVDEEKSVTEKLRQKYEQLQADFDSIFGDLSESQQEEFNKQFGDLGIQLTEGATEKEIQSRIDALQNKDVQKYLQQQREISSKEYKELGKLIEEEYTKLTLDQQKKFDKKFGDIGKPLIEEATLESIKERIAKLEASKKEDVINYIGGLKIVGGVTGFVKKVKNGLKPVFEKFKSFFSSNKKE